MKIVDQSYEIKLIAPFGVQLDLIENCGRVAYASEGNISEGSSKQFTKMIVNKNHGAVLEHSMMTAIFTTDRGVSHELVRHRLASFTQESTRYCDFSRDKFNGQVTFIRPIWFDMTRLQSLLSTLEDPDSTSIESENELAWVQSMEHAERTYLTMLNNGMSPQQARAVLPNSLKTKIAVTANFREWRHIFQLRAIEKAAHPQMRDLMIPLYQQCRELCPEVFNLGEPE